MFSRNGRTNTGSEERECRYSKKNWKAVSKSLICGVCVCVWGGGILNTYFQLELRIWIILGLNEHMKVSETQLEALKKKSAGKQIKLSFLFKHLRYLQSVFNAR